MTLFTLRNYFSMYTLVEFKWYICISWNIHFLAKCIPTVHIWSICIIGTLC